MPTDGKPIAIKRSVTKDKSRSKPSSVYRFFFFETSVRIVPRRARGVGIVDVVAVNPASLAKGGKQRAHCRLGIDISYNRGSNNHGGVRDASGPLLLATFAVFEFEFSG